MVGFDKESQTRILKIAEMRAAGKPLEGEDLRIGEVLDMHSEFDGLWQQGELACYPQEVDGKVVNPFVHVVLHVRVDRQIQNEEPYYVTVAFERLTSQGMDPHECLHAIIGEYADIYFATFRKGDSFDNLSYQTRIDALHFVKEEEEEE